MLCVNKTHTAHYLSIHSRGHSSRLWRGVGGRNVILGVAQRERPELSSSTAPSKLISSTGERLEHHPHAINASPAHDQAQQTTSQSVQAAASTTATISASTARNSSFHADEDGFEMSAAPQSSSPAQPAEAAAMAAAAEAAMMFDSSHISSVSPLLLLYCPLGALLASFRMCLWILGIAIDSPSFTNPAIVKAYLKLLGFSTRWSNLEQLPKGRHVLVSNHISVGDLMMMFSMPQRYVHLITNALPAAATRASNLPVLLKPACPQVMEQLASWQADMPVHVFPEGGMTNGRAMLRFSRGFTKLLQPGVPVAPVAIKVSNTFRVSTHTLESSFLANLFWFSFSPATVMEAKVLPPMEQLPGEGRGAFVQRVQQAIAEELQVPVSGITIQQKRKLVQQASKA